MGAEIGAREKGSKADLPRKGDYVQATVTIGGFEHKNFTGDVDQILNRPKGPWVHLTNGQSFPAISGNGMQVKLNNLGKVKSAS